MSVVIKGDSNVNLDFSTGGRITGDFSNATAANRVMFQSSTTNGFTAVSVIPNGTSTSAFLQTINNADPANASTMQIAVAVSESQLSASRTGTGTYLPMTFYTGGSERVRIDTSGNVGIGTSSPGNKLHVNGDLRTQGNFFLANSTGQKIYPYYASATNHNYIGAESDGSISFGTGTSSPSERARIDSSGNVGIGTSSPGAKLDVNGSLRANSSLSAGGVCIIASGSFNNNSVNTIGTFQESHIIIHIVTEGNKLSSIPVYPNGGAGIAYVYNYMNPATAAWTNTGGGNMNLTFSCAGSSANTYNVIMSSGNGTLTVQRTAGAAAYAVYVQRIASL